MRQTLFAPLTIAGISHHTASVPEIEEFRFADEDVFLTEAREWFKGVALLQTCNRVEVIVHGEPDILVEFLESRGRSQFRLYQDKEALSHLLELAAGIDSLIIGEDQILGQLRRTLTKSEELGVASPILTLCINKAIHTGSEVRRRTGINNGAISVGSAAVLLAEEQLHTLEGKRILILGSGEMGVLVTQALAAKQLSAIYVANRTLDRARVLAHKIDGTAVPMDDLYRYLALSDVVICCTAAPHPVIRAKDVSEAMKGRTWPLDGEVKPIIIVDIAQPRDVEEEVGKIDGVCLFTIDDLRQVNDTTAQLRQEAATHARAFLEEELDQFIKQYNRRAADETLATLHTWAETVRVRERDRAFARLQGYDDHAREIVEDLTRALTRKLLADVTMSIRFCAERGEITLAEELVSAIIRGEGLCSRK
ncbi:MAG TPA: glutamyl-tRNA reductase [Methanospirillum sp.]|uniref:glutamyl-tRNA reductase n=1 Tax=Methanospirillum sp. TaxID=45200 RepID=UPI002BAC44DD|nr:glutamyl-tRNA reductase [Methanospirillum sp.]HWQ64371.1 glutamyl-tRNA reductase [Methanospirillum sp.]